MAFDAIFQPLSFRNLTIKNRALRSNVAGRFDFYDGSGSHARVRWESSFAAGGVGAIVSSFVPVHVRGRILPNYAMIDDDRHIPFWRAVGDAVHAYDCRFILQLSHGGRQRDLPGIEYPLGLSSTSKPDPMHGFPCEAMTTAQIRDTVAQFAEGARRAREAGLDGVELHAANGYLFTQFLSSAINDRKDEYGGPLENRARFLLEVVTAIRRRVGADFHLQVKLSIQEFMDAVAFFGAGPSGNTAAESVQVCRWLEAAGVDALHVSTGGFFPHPRNPAGVGLPLADLASTYDAMVSSGDRVLRNLILFRTLPDLATRQWSDAAPKPEEIEGSNLADARRVKAAVGIPVICTGGFQTASFVADALQRGDCDAVSMARPLIANRDLVRVWQRGQDRADRPCTYCNRCLANVVENPLGCYDETRYPSREAMIAETLAVYQPPAYQPQGAFTDDGTTPAAPGAREPLAAASVTVPGTEAVAARFRHRPWHDKPRLLAMGDLVQIRNDLRQFNLHDTEEPPLPREPIPDALLDPALKAGRSPDGTFNDLGCPAMGAAGRRFGRNVPLAESVPDTTNLLVPNPRHVSRELMTRDTFQPASILNLLAAAWIQFMVHDWFVHKRSDSAFHEIPCAPGDDFGDPSIRVPRSVPDAAPAGSTRPPAYVNENSHWWDASQIYGSSRDKEKTLRTGLGGKLVIEPTGLLPVDPVTGVNVGGFTDNWWVGLAMLHTLFTLEHNYLCDLLAHQHRDWDDQTLFARAKLINSALMAKIHTVEWTPAILPHPVTQTAMRVNWYGLAGQDVQDVLQFLDDSELLGGIVGSTTDHHTAPYALTEEFVSVYRMHPLIPDEVAFHSLATGGHLETAQLPAMSGQKTADLFGRVTVPDMFYSFGIAHPGAVTLHNYPRFLQNLRRDNGEHLDLAAVDILRDRERGVPRYNRFRRLLRKPPVRSFDELTDNPEWRKQLKAVYGNDLEAVDLMTGLYAEPLPQGFGFSETAFRIFVLMASRRLKSDRFFTTSWNEETYSRFGLDYVNTTTMLDVLTRHYPHLRPALQGVTNAFQPWKAVHAPGDATRGPH